VLEGRVTTEYSDTTKQTTGYPYTPVVPVQGTTVSVTGTFTNAGTEKIPVGLTASLWLVDFNNPAWAAWEEKPCSPPKISPNATITLSKAVAPGKQAPLQFKDVRVGSVTAGQARDLQYFVIIADPDCE
jgi:hypothetical protein